MLALEGILVLDLCRRYPGAYTTMFLGDFGAEVIKVDPPGGTLPTITPDTEEFAAYFAPDRNKRSIVLNLRSSLGQEVLYRLVKKADVLVEGFRPGVMKRLKADYDAVKGMNPRLIYCSLSGFGSDGPYASMPGHDMTYTAISGTLSLVGPRDGPPYFANNFLGDIAGAGLHGVIGILLALQARERTGQGQFVDISYTDGAISLLTVEASRYFFSGVLPRRGETRLTGGAPHAQIFKCRDGEYFTIGCVEPYFWEDLCRAVDREDLIPFYSPPPEKRDEVVAELARIFLTRSRDEWFQFFKDKNIPVGPVYNLNETFSDPQVLHRQMVVEVEHPHLGKIKQVGMAIKLSHTPGSIRTLGTPLSAHTRDILQELGYSDKEIEKFYQEAVVA